MESESVWKGGCLCGQIRYVVSGAPSATAICHCRSCQRAFGAESVAWARYESGQVEWSGDSRRTFQSSERVERTFCGTCGTSLSYQDANDSVDIAIASLDDPESLSPQREVYLSHRISWNARHPELAGYQKFMSDDSS